ncbi:MAG: AAA family ATPase, partial [SAR324 cluster bacterium]|nr:AAA family ATPase [SAR324 cluster bacterium]
MICSACSAENREGARFCQTCGVPLPRNCPGCGRENAADARFCDHCGRDLSLAGEPGVAARAEPTPLAAAGSIHEGGGLGERRQATVLFSDLSGYTALNERLDPEEVEGVMSRLKTEAVRIVETHGGIVNQFVGDEVVALFGIPDAHEDDPMRAVRAALDLHRMAAAISGEVEGRIGSPLRWHSGINTGLIVTHVRDDREGRYGITGDTVNTAARLVNEAAADEILVAPETRRLIGPFFEVESRPPVELRGKAQPIIPFRIVGESQVRTRLEAAEKKGLTPFTGRAGELTTLRACLEKAVAGRGQFVSLLGEAGIGKSRLLLEFRQSVDHDRITVLEGRCQTYGSDTPFLPFIDALRHGLHLLAEGSPAELREKAIANVRAIDPSLEPYLPHFLHLLSLPSGEFALPANLQGEELRRALVEALAAIITLNTRHKPMVFIMEDWQWADEASDAALKYLIGLAANFPLLVVAVYRPEFARSWGNPEHYTPIVLRPFDGPETAELCRAVLNVTALPDELAAPVTERTGGNPFFVEELCHALIEEGTVVVENGRASLTQPLETVRLPETVHGVIRARIDRLDPESRDVLRYAAVIGLEFAIRVLERVHPHAARLAPALERLRNQELIQQMRVLPEAAYRFKNVLTQEVVYETLLLQQRREFHALVGRALEAQYADRLEEHIEALAHHFERGEVWDRAAEYLLQAAEKAKLHWGYPAALGLCRSAQTALEKGGATAERKARALVLAGDLESLLGNLEEANQSYDQALEATTDFGRRHAIENRRHREYFASRAGAKIACYEHGSGKETLLFVNPL